MKFTEVLSEASDLSSLMREYQAKGWKITKTPGGHFKWLAPDRKSFVIDSSTSSDIRSIRNHEARLRQIERNLGFIPEKPERQVKPEKKVKKPTTPPRPEPVQHPIRIGTHPMTPAEAKQAIEILNTRFTNLKFIMAFQSVEGRMRSGWNEATERDFIEIMEEAIRTRTYAKIYDNFARGDRNDLNFVIRDAKTGDVIPCRLSDKGKALTIIIQNEIPLRIDGIVTVRGIWKFQHGNLKIDEGILDQYGLKWDVFNQAEDYCRFLYGRRPTIEELNDPKFNTYELVDDTGEFAGWRVMSDDSAYQNGERIVKWEAMRFLKNDKGQWEPNLRGSMTNPFGRDYVNRSPLYDTPDEAMRFVENVEDSIRKYGDPTDFHLRPTTVSLNELKDINPQESNCAIIAISEITRISMDHVWRHARKYWSKFGVSSKSIDKILHELGWRKLGIRRDLIGKTIEQARNMLKNDSKNPRIICFFKFRGVDHAVPFVDGEFHNTLGARLVRIEMAYQYAK